MRFSERHGFKSVRETMQIESVDTDLRNGLWSVLKINVYDCAYYSSGMYSGGRYLSNNEHHAELCTKLWMNYFKLPLDELPSDWDDVWNKLRDDFFECKWYEVYDLIEFISKNFPRYKFQEKFNSECNLVLEREMSAYRFIGNDIGQISEKQEIDEIEDVLISSKEPIQEHIKRALELLSDRKNPDYRNSIKESISAVESYVRIVTNDEKGTLGDLLKELQSKHDLHKGLKSAFSSLYGYTSDEGGIRHSLIDTSKSDFNDAKFMLVACCAFINYSRGKFSQ